MSAKNPFKEILNTIKKDHPGLVPKTQPISTMERQRLEALYLVSQQLSRILDPEKLFSVVINQIVELMQAEHAVILMREADQLNIRISYNIDNQSEQNALKFSQSVVNKVMNDYLPLYSTNALDDKRFSQFQTIHDLEILSFICVPVFADDDVIGTIYVDNRHIAQVFSEADVQFLQAFANLIGIAIRNSGAYHQIEELNLSLEEKVAQRTAELNQTVVKLQETQNQLLQSEKMASMGRLITGFMHEFNNPINFIYSNLPHLESYAGSLLKLIDELTDNLDVDAQAALEEKYDLAYIKKDLIKLIDSMKVGAQRSREIVKDLKLVAGGGESGTVLIDWNKHVVKMIEIVLKRKAGGPKIYTLFPEAEIKISANKTELSYVILNILDNAIDAGAKVIRIESKIENNELVCQIKDDGSGIAEKDITKIFDPFYTTKEVGEGMGLGLSIVYGTISHLGGKISILNSSENGTTFKLTLPLER